MNIIDLNDKTPVNTAALLEVMDVIGPLVKTLNNELNYAINQTTQQLKKLGTNPSPELAEALAQLAIDNEILSLVNHCSEHLSYCMTKELEFIKRINTAMHNRKPVIKY